MKKINDKNILTIAIENGCKTVRDLAVFLRTYNPQPMLVA